MNTDKDGLIKRFQDYVQPHIKFVLPLEGAIRMELQEGTPIFRASNNVQNRIKTLLLQQQDSQLTPEEEQELDSYEEIDDYLSFLNRIVRNVAPNQNNRIL